MRWTASGEPPALVGVHSTTPFAHAFRAHRRLGVPIEAFRRVPLHLDYCPHPGNTSFSDVRISYPDDLTEVVTTGTFLYSNSTATRPTAPQTLTTIASFGSSPVVDHPGRGAYFFDCLARGVCRLEGMPDAIRVRDPYEKPNLSKHVSRIAWNAWPMRITLPDPGADFAASGLNAGNTLRGHAAGETLRVRPRHLPADARRRAVRA